MLQPHHGLPPIFTAASVLPLIKEGHKCTSSWTCGDSEWMTKPLLPSGLPGRGPLFECVRCRVQTGLQRRRGPFRAGSRWRFTGRWVRSRWGEEAVWVYACVCVGSPRRKGTPLRSSPVKLDACGGGEKKKKAPAPALTVKREPEQTHLYGNPSTQWASAQAGKTQMSRSEGKTRREVIFYSCDRRLCLFLLRGPHRKYQNSTLIFFFTQLWYRPSKTPDL